MTQYLLKLTLPLYVLDQITKWLILWKFDAPQPGFRPDDIPVIPGLFNLVRVHNTGMAFGRFNDSPYANVAFGIVAVTALVVIVVLWRRNAFPTVLAQTSVALLISGILGNLTDRLVHGYVVDFLDFHVGNWHWPSFNVADSCIVIAAALLFISAFQAEPEAPEQGADAENGD